MRSNLKVKLKGKVTVTVRDAKTNAILEVRCFTNIWTTAGVTQLLKLAIGESTAKITHCAVGSGSTAPAVGNTVMETEIGRVTLQSYSRTGLVATLTFFFATGDCNGTWNEEGLMSASSGGTLFAHTLFDAAITKTSSKTVTVDHELTFA